MFTRNNHLPPPAQAQAQPAQAHAQAQLCPPPPPPPRYETLDVGFGIGLVELLTPEVKVPTLPRTLLEKFCTPVITEAAKVDPGTLFMERPDDMEGIPVPTLGDKVDPEDR